MSSDLVRDTAFPLYLTLLVYLTFGLGDFVKGTLDEVVELHPLLFILHLTGWDTGLDARIL